MSSARLLRLIVGIACLVGIYEALVFYLGADVSPQFEKTWFLTFGILTACWVDADSHDRPDIYRPSFDFGFFIYLAWIVYLPYYFVRTRGNHGWLWILGLAGLALLGT